MARASSGYPCSRQLHCSCRSSWIFLTYCPIVASVGEPGGLPGRSFPDSSGPASSLPARGAFLSPLPGDPPVPLPRPLIPTEGPPACSEPPSSILSSVERQLCKEGMRTVSDPCGSDGWGGDTSPAGLPSPRLWLSHPHRRPLPSPLAPQLSEPMLPRRLTPMLLSHDCLVKSSCRGSVLTIASVWPWASLVFAPLSFSTSWATVHSSSWILCPLALISSSCRWRAALTWASSSVLPDSSPSRSEICCFRLEMLPGSREARPRLSSVTRIPMLLTSTSTGGGGGISLMLSSISSRGSSFSGMGDGRGGGLGVGELGVVTTTWASLLFCWSSASSRTTSAFRDEKGGLGKERWFGTSSSPSGGSGPSRISSGIPGTRSPDSRTSRWVAARGVELEKPANPSAGPKAPSQTTPSPWSGGRAGGVGGPEFRLGSSEALVCSSVAGMLDALRSWGRPLPEVSSASPGAAAASSCLAVSASRAFRW